MLTDRKTRVTLLTTSSRFDLKRKIRLASIESFGQSSSRYDLKHKIRLISCCRWVALGVLRGSGSIASV
jgi:hypothetical protein